ncbi:mitochondrial ribonuclease P catalytic subunit isoform X2 [Varanus komodoensis]|uniref:Mitochondrial ribonuclease P catalytic subunit n=1 Tax=Varanus komodoensis TaxID=61221 RepID=A0A8D2L9B6_VARKO|nr:mitochondrial ribonuclease P catalytic subunit isoform X2 [Varanus komodoensis]
MVLFFQTSSWILQTLLRKHQMLSPFLRLQQLPTAFGCFIFTTSYQWAKSVDSETLHPVSAQGSSKGRYDGTKNRTRNGYYSPLPFNLFAAGASKKRSASAEVLKDAEYSVTSGRETLCPPEKPLTVEEWKKLMDEFADYYKFEEAMLMQMVTHKSHIDVAKSLLAAVANRDGNIPYNLLVMYLSFCVSQNEIEEIYDVYDIMKARFKTLETTAYGLLIKGLSGTERWREGLKLLEEIKKVITPSKANYGDCIRGAIVNQEINLASQLFREMLANNVMPDLSTIQTLFDTGRTMKDDHMKTELIHILFYLRDYQVYPGEALMQSIKQWFESGRCPSCNQFLESINLSPGEYSTLKEKIIKDVIQGPDIFRKTTPQELEEFQAFVNQQPPYDIVVDGLNVANFNNRSNRSQTLRDVVTYLAQQKPRILVLGRKHMLNGTQQWKRNNMAAIQKIADFFFTEDISEDDPFLLYATLHSGNHCRFVTGDLLRDHKACLSDSHTQRLFFKWQRGHQMVLSRYRPEKIIKFEPVLEYDTIVQTTGNTWHIPYDDNFLERASYEVPIRWLCLQQK